MKYSENYTKLDDRVYTTIRRYRKGKVGDIVVETYPKGTHRSRIVDVKRESLKKMNLRFLRDDTDRKTRKGVYDLIQSFYKKPIDFENEKMYIYFLVKLSVAFNEMRVSK